MDSFSVQPRTIEVSHTSGTGGIYPTVNPIIPTLLISTYH